MKHRLTSHLKSPVITTNREEFPPIDSTIAGTEREMTENLAIEKIPEIYRDEWTSVDIANGFVAAMVSRYPFTKSGTGKGWCPATRIGENSFEFVLPIREWPSELEEDYFTVLEYWECSSEDVPTSSEIRIKKVDSGESCRD